MGAIKNRKQARNRLKELLKDSSKVLIIHYSHAQYPDDDIDDTISPLITAIVIRSLDDQINEHFSIYYEADKAGIIKEEISDSLRELELQVLKSFNRFVKRHAEYIWIHWEMKNIHFGFPAIKHRFDKLFYGTKESLHEIPSHKNVNLYSVLENMYGSEFVELSDSLASIIKLNSISKVLPSDYLNVDYEGVEFEKQNYSVILKSLDCKVGSIRSFLQKYCSNNKVKVYKRNTYSIFIDFINHPIFVFIGWAATILGMILGVIAIF